MTSPSDLALPVFGKSTSFDVAQDSVGVERGQARAHRAGSTLDPSVLKSTHVVYLGYISGMGMLGDRVFANSRLALGGPFDELRDQQTGETYVSTAM